MKDIWNVEITAMNGTVRLFTETVACTSKSLAEQVARTLKEKNESGGNINVYVSAYKSTLYELVDEVPILNEK